jgi:hypothetical protein
MRIAFAEWCMQGHRKVLMLLRRRSEQLDPASINPAAIEREINRSDRIRRTSIRSLWARVLQTALETDALTRPALSSGAAV